MHKHDQSRSEDEDNSGDDEENSVNKRRANCKESVTARQMM